MAGETNAASKVGISAQRCCMTFFLTGSQNTQTWPDYWGTYILKPGFNCAYTSACGESVKEGDYSCLIFSQVIPLEVIAGWLADKRMPLRFTSDAD